ncbi:hypothetical protein [Kutzneria sp. NPDC052558]|uniref:hypothetical protein n=1 Tax=Kutzneria sp. NPDC052558 TaxID=3364121 RepID=UPI0037C6C094
MKGPFLTLNVMKGPFLTLNVVKGSFMTFNVRIGALIMGAVGDRAAVGRTGGGDRAAAPRLGGPSTGCRPTGSERLGEVLRPHGPFVEQVRVTVLTGRKSGAQCGFE